MQRLTWSCSAPALGKRNKDPAKERRTTQTRQSAGICSQHRSPSWFSQHEVFHLLSELLKPLLGRIRSRGKCWAAIQLSHRPALSGHAVHEEVDGLDSGGQHGRRFVYLRHTHRPQRRPYPICTSRSGNDITSPMITIVSCRYMNLCCFKNTTQSLTQTSHRYLDALLLDCRKTSCVIRDVTRLHHWKLHISHWVTWLRTLSPLRHYYHICSAFSYICAVSFFYWLQEKLEANFLHSIFTRGDDRNSVYREVYGKRFLTFALVFVFAITFNTMIAISWSNIC